MKYIGKTEDEEFVFEAPFDLTAGTQVRFVKQLGPPPEYPPEPNKPKEFVVQCHWRGRSVSDLTPVIVKHRGQVEVIPIAELWMRGEGEDERKLDGYEVWAKDGWESVSYVMRKPYHNDLIRVWTKGGVVDATNEHSLFQDGKPIAVKELNLGDRIDLAASYPIMSGEDDSIDLDFAWMLGFFLAEGSADTHGPKIRKVVFAQKDPEIFVPIMRLAKRYGLSYSVYGDGQGKYKLELTGISRPFRECYSAFSAHSSRLRKSYFKKVPSFVFSWSTKAKEALLDGFNEGDGLKFKDYPYSGQPIEYTNTSQALLQGLLLLASEVYPERKCSINVQDTVLRVRLVNPNHSRNMPKDRIKAKIEFKNADLRGKRNPNFKDGQHTDGRLIRQQFLRYSNRRYVYDIETVSHSFVAGVGLVLAHNTVHGDYRVLRTSKDGEGWTLLFQRPGAPPVPDLVTAKRVCSQQSLFKISLKTGNVLSRQVVTTIRGQKRTITRPGAIRAEMKAEEIPAMWVRLEGRTALPPLWPETVVKNWDKFLPVSRNQLRKEGWSLARCKKIIAMPEWKKWKETRDTDLLKPLGNLNLSPEPPIGGTQAWPGVFYILDHGTVTYGVRKPWVFEYFFTDSDLFHGRFLFRLVEHAVNKAEIVLPVGEKEVRPRQGTYWILMTPTEPEHSVQPYILGSSAAEKDIILPYGVAALPQDFQKAIPDEYRYWKIRDKKKRREVLDALRESWDGKSLDSLKPAKKYVVKADNKFKLLYRSWRGQHVIRFGPSTREYILLFSKSKKAIALMNNPIKMDTVAGYDENLPFDKLWEISKEREIPPDSTLNPTKDTPCMIREIDGGTYKVFDEGEGFFKVAFSGDQLKGLYFFREEEPGAGIWEVTRSGGPQIQKDALLRGKFVLQRHELPSELGQSHWDIRIQPEGWDKLIEWNIWDADPSQSDTFTGVGKECDDPSWMEIKRPAERDVDGYPTRVIPLDSGEAELGVSTGVNDPESLLSRKQAGIVFNGKKLEGIWRIRHNDDAWKFTKEHDVKIAKADKKKQLVYGVVLAPYEVDSWLDYERPEEIEKAAHIYLIRMWKGDQPSMVGKEHREPIEAIPVESYIAPVDFWYPGTPHTDEYKVKAGSWVLVTYIKDKGEFEKILKGKYGGYSVQGLGRRKKVDASVRSQLD